MEGSYGPSNTHQIGNTDLESGKIGTIWRSDLIMINEYLQIHDIHIFSYVNAKYFYENRPVI